MVDFKKLKAERSQRPVDPTEVFRRLPRSAGIGDLYASQADVLKEWHARRDERDTVIKLHTGGGKTLVALLIAQSALNERRKPVVYLAPNNQLVDQVLSHANEYDIPAFKYEKNQPIPHAVCSADAVYVCNYHAMFNGLSRFGVRNSGKDVFEADTVIVDDAHTGFSILRDQFTIAVRRQDAQEDYQHLSAIFRADFQGSGRSGVFDDIVSNVDRNGILEVPAWAWKVRSSQIHEYIRERQETYKYQWPFLRDEFDNCHVLLSSKAFVITAMLPFVDMVPTFSECKRRVFMSATLSNDSAIVRSFDADPRAVSAPIRAKSLAGVSERMILVPALTRAAVSEESARSVVTKVAESGRNVVVLVPSEESARSWESEAEYVSGDQVADAVRDLRSGGAKKPYVIANRYDGIDLPHAACRLVVLAGLPRAANEYDLYRASLLTAGHAIHDAIGQKIEQGMGRGARGPADWCVVLLLGDDVAAWISRKDNRALLTASTRAQVEMGLQISRDIDGEEDIVATIEKCLSRDKDWLSYHAETLASLTADDVHDEYAVGFASTERKVLREMRMKHYERVVERTEKFCGTHSDDDPSGRSWLLQLAARAAEYSGDESCAKRLEREAYGLNRNMPRPRVHERFTPQLVPSGQAERIVACVERHEPRRGFVAEFRRTVGFLSPESTSNQFEDALGRLGEYLGFASERPEHSGGQGPDVLWLLEDGTGLVIEAKSRKKDRSPFNKADLGQLLTAVEWFKEAYPNREYRAVSVHPTNVASCAVVPTGVWALTLEALRTLVGDATALLSVLAESALPAAEMPRRCQSLLEHSGIESGRICEKYLTTFRPQ